MLKNTITYAFASIFVALFSGNSNENVSNDLSNNSFENSYTFPFKKEHQTSNTQSNTLVILKDHTYRIIESDSCKSQIELTGFVDPDFSPENRLQISNDDGLTWHTIDVTPQITTIGALDYQDPQWVGQQYDYASGYAGEGFGLTSGRRGAPEQISIGSIGGRNALTYVSGPRDQDWYDANLGASTHSLYGVPDNEVRDDFYWYQNQSPWTASDNSYFSAHVYRADGSDVGFRVPSKYEYFGQLYDTWPAVLVYDNQLLLQGPNRDNTLFGNYDPMDYIGWITIGIHISFDGNVHYYLADEYVDNVFIQDHFLGSNRALTDPYDSVTYDFWPIVQRGDANITIGNENGSGNAIQKLFYGKEQNDAPWTFMDTDFYDADEVVNYKIRILDYKGNIQEETTQTVVIVDTVPPEIPILETLTFECSNLIIAPTTIDACDGVIMGTANDLSVLSQEGTHSVLWTFTDSSGNSSTASQTIIINDTTAPTVASLRKITAELSTTVAAPIISDICDGTITGTTTNSTNLSGQGTHTINWTFTDQKGNSTSVPQTIVLSDIIETDNSTDTLVLLKDFTFNVTALDDCNSQIEITGLVDPDFLPSNKLQISNDDGGTWQTLELVQNLTQIGAIDYQEARWENEKFNYTSGWAGRGFGLSGTQRGAPENISIGEVEGRTALTYVSGPRDQDWYDANPGADMHSVYMNQDGEGQDDFYWYQPDWELFDNPYFSAHVYKPSGNILAFRLTAYYSNADRTSFARVYPAMWIHNGHIGLRGPGRNDISVSSNIPDDYVGWLTAGLHVSSDGDLYYYLVGDHVENVFKDEYLITSNKKITEERGQPYFPMSHQNDATVMISNLFYGGNNAIQDLYYGKELNDASWTFPDSTVYGNTEKVDYRIRILDSKDNVQEETVQSLLLSDNIPPVVPILPTIP